MRAHSHWNRLEMQSVTVSANDLVQTAVLGTFRVSEPLGTA